MQVLISMIKAVVEQGDDLRALAVCGSWARGDPRPDSDLDLLVIAREPDAWRRDQSRIAQLPFARAGLVYLRHSTADYGVVWSAHVDLGPEAELELTFARESWACVEPVDPGTRQVVADAFTVIVDKDAALERLVRARGPSG